MNTFITRTLSAAVLAGIFIGAILWSPYTFALLLVILTVATMHEFYHLSSMRGGSPLSRYATLVGAFSVGVNFTIAWGGLSIQCLFLLIPLLFIPFIVELYRKSEHPFENIAWTLAGLFYIALPFSLMTYIGFGQGVAEGSYTPYLVLGYIFVVWINDVGAYLTGMTFGRHRLFERISPKKSWEGFWGGLFFAVLFAWGVGYVAGLSPIRCVGGALVIVVTGVWGDLIESMFKRSLGIKDSGKLIPGHGGMLDRFDAILISAPFIFIYLTFFGLEFSETLLP